MEVAGVHIRVTMDFTVRGSLGVVRCTVSSNHQGIRHSTQLCLNRPPCCCSTVYHPPTWNGHHSFLRQGNLFAEAFPVFPETRHRYWYSISEQGLNLPNAGIVIESLPKHFPVIVFKPGFCAILSTACKQQCWYDHFL